MQFTDRLIVDSDIRRTREGYAVLSARVARAGNVQVYRGVELGITDKDVLRIYRPDEAVFRKDALASYAGVPITFGHPTAKVDASTWRDMAVGEVGVDVLRDGEFVRVPMMLRDAKAISAVEGGVRELSMGYDANLTMQDGQSPAGEVYDAVMSDFKMNHVALVETARGGHELRIGDGAFDGGKDRDSWGASPVTIADERTVQMTDTLRTVVVDGLSVSTTDQGAQAIAKLLKAVEDGQTKITDADNANAEAIRAKDAEITARDEEIGTLKADLKKAQDAHPKPEDMDKLVADRAALVTVVKAIDAKIDPKGMSDAGLRKAAVAARFGDDMVADASDAEVSGMFRAISKDIKPADPFASAVRDGVHSSTTTDNGQAAYEQRLSDAWKLAPKEA